MCFRFFCAVLCALLLGGCKTTKTVYIPTETASVRTDSTAAVRVIDRLIVERDTVNTYTKGDTVFKEVTKWRIRNTESHDTVFQAKTDSVYVEKPYPVEVVKEVEKKMHWWQTALMWAGGGVLLCVALKAAWPWVRKKVKGIDDQIMLK